MRERVILMTRENYIKLTSVIRDNPRRIRLIRFLNRLFTGFVFLLYPALLLLFFLEHDPFLERAVIVPAVTFVMVTIFRKVYNSPRPYEKFDLPPAIEKETAGKSFPSRHVFSVFIIAMTAFYSDSGMGTALFIIGIALGIIRVVGGVHEPRDVIAGALFAVLSGYIGYWLI